MKPTPPLTRQEAATVLKVCVATIDLWIKNGKLRASKISRTVRIPQSEIERVLNVGGAI